MVRWKGYDESYDTWEPAEELKTNAPEVVKKFYWKHPNAPQQISATLFKGLPWRCYEPSSFPHFPRFKRLLKCPLLIGTY